MANGPSDALAWPSDTAIEIFEYVPTSPDCGAPLISPVEELKLAQEGSPETVNDNVSLSGSLAVGVKE
jgi:hypothetical protein